MAKHIFITNIDGGYFYRIYPKLSKLHFPDTQEKSIHYDLFNPPPSVPTHHTLTLIYGKFIQKFNDKGLTVELTSKGSYLITCMNTGQQEERKLESKLHVVVPDHIYNYPFIENRIYSISIHEVQDITP